MTVTVSASGAGPIGATGTGDTDRSVPFAGARRLREMLGGCRSAGR
jgi:hypothetical protein